MKGSEVRDPLRRSWRSRSRGSGGAAPTTTGARSRGSAAASRSTRSTASSSSLVAAGRRQPRLGVRLAADRRREQDQHLRRGRTARASSGPNALTGDPNHLGIMLIVPLLVSTPLYLRLERGHRLRARLGAPDRRSCSSSSSRRCRAAACSGSASARSPALPYRRYLRSRALLAPLAARSPCSCVVVITRFHYFEVVLRSRVQTGGGSQSAHFQVYDFVPQILHSHPLFGLGLNNFSVFYELVTGKTNWGPHSFYVSLLVETGLVGTALFARLPRLGVPAPARRPRARPRARRSCATRSPRACGRSRGAGRRRSPGRWRRTSST